MRSYEREQFWLETAVFVGITLLMFSWFVEPVWKSLFFSVLLSILFVPLHRKLSGIIGEGFSATLVAVCTLMIPVVPLVVGTYSAVVIANDLIADISTEGSQTQKFVYGLFESIKVKFPALDGYIKNPSDLLSENGIIRKNLGNVSSITQTILGTVYSSVISLVFWVGVILFGVYYQLRAGGAPMRFARTILPIRPEFVDHTFAEFVQMSRAMIKVTLIVGTIQGAIGGTVLWWLQTPYWFLWMFMMVIFSMVPIAGAGVVLVPASLIYIFAVPEGATAGVTIAITFGVVSVIDNILKPYIVGGDSEMEPGFVLLGVVAGLMSFGAIGAFVGPIMFAFGLAYYRVYIEMHSERHIKYEALQSMRTTEDQKPWVPFAPRGRVSNTRRKK